MSAAGRRPGSARFNLGIVEAPFAEAAPRLGFGEGRLLDGIVFAIGTSLPVSSGLQDRCSVLQVEIVATIGESRSLKGFERVIVFLEAEQECFP
jgi:hypothetical protein